MGRPCEQPRPRRFTDDAIPPTCVLSSGVTALGGRAPTLNSDDPPYLQPGGPGASRGAQGEWACAAGTGRWSPQEDRRIQAVIGMSLARRRCRDAG